MRFSRTATGTKPSAWGGSERQPTPNVNAKIWTSQPLILTNGSENAFTRTNELERELYAGTSPRKSGANSLFVASLNPCRPILCWSTWITTYDPLPHSRPSLWHGLHDGSGYVEGNPWLIGTHPSYRALEARNVLQMGLAATPGLLSWAWRRKPLAWAFLVGPVVDGVKHLQGARAWVALEK